jgi:hypothetical protein
MRNTGERAQEGGPCVIWLREVYIAGVGFFSVIVGGEDTRYPQPFNMKERCE